MRQRLRKTDMPREKNLALPGPDDLRWGENANRAGFADPVPVCGQAIRALLQHSCSAGASFGRHRAWVSRSAFAFTTFAVTGFKSASRNFRKDSDFRPGSKVFA